MANNVRFLMFVLTLGLCAVCTALGALQAAEEPVTQPAFDLKNPTPWLALSGDFRFRVAYEKARKLDREAAENERLSTRYRVRLGAAIKQSEDAALNVRLATEPRYYHRPASMDDQFIYDEVLFDKLNYWVQNVFDLPLTATIGRQSINLGSGWLISDGTPLDGSRTGYFDAARFTYDFKDAGVTADMIWVENHADSAKWLKPIHDRDFDLAEQDEQGAIFYLSKKTGEKSRLDGYAIYKRDHDRKTTKGYEGETYTIGAMAEGWLDANWKYRAEVAPQAGHRDGKSLHSFGTNDQLTYSWNDVHKNRVCFGYEYLSGTRDPKKYFDRLWGRIDTWSAIYQGCIDAIDEREYDSSNLHRAGIEWTTEPMDKLETMVGCHLLLADDNTSNGGTGGLNRSGKIRGELLKMQARYKASKNLYHVLESELFIPGNYYNDDKNDVAVLARYSIVFTW